MMHTPHTHTLLAAIARWRRIEAAANRQTGNLSGWHTGMSLRSWFAGQALTGLIMSQADNAAGIVKQGDNARLYANAALRIADAIIANLE